MDTFGSDSLKHENWESGREVATHIQLAAFRLKIEKKIQSHVRKDDAIMLRHSGYGTTHSHRHAVNCPN